MKTIVKVGMADLNIVCDPGMLTTLGLGSCVGIALFDTFSRIGGLAHIMLPDSTQVKNNTNKAKFADTAVVELISLMCKAGARRGNIRAKIAGGSQMFAFAQSSEVMRIGERNVIATKAVLSELGIPILAEDTGGNYGRTIELYTESGVLLVKTIGSGIKQL